MSFISKLFKGVGKIVKGFVKGVKKLAGKIFGSKIGKILMGAILIYTGGMALGVFQNPFALNAAGSMQGLGLSANMKTAMASGQSFVKALGTTIKQTGSNLVSAVTGQAPASEFTVGGLEPGASLATDLGLDSGVGAAVDAGVTGSPFTLEGAAIDSITKGSNLATQGKTLASRMGTTFSKSAISDSMLPSAAKTLTAAGSAGKTATLFGKSLDFMNKNKILTLMGANAIAGAFTDDESDLLRDREQAIRARWAEFDPEVAAFDFKPKPGPREKRTEAYKPRQTLSSLREDENYGLATS